MSLKQNKIENKLMIQHILKNPDKYIGSVENVTENLWVYDNDTNKIVNKSIKYIPGLYKLFDEAIIYSCDNVIRMIEQSKTDKNTKLVTYIDVNISLDGTITIINDGNSIDVKKHQEYDVFIPEMIFSDFTTSTNYDKNFLNKYGLGIKLAFIWSTNGSVEIVDHVNKLKYIQTFNNNLTDIGNPSITKYSKALESYIKITFKPDYEYFGITGLTSDMIALFKKRVYDIAAVTNHSVKIKYNDIDFPIENTDIPIENTDIPIENTDIPIENTVIPIKNFDQYISMYLGEKVTRIYEQNDERWEYAVAFSPNEKFIKEFTQVSFVNGICTNKGGTHVDYIIKEICHKLCVYIEKKKNIKVEYNTIKNQIILFLRCDIQNPSFYNQTKDYMTTPFSKFGSTCFISDDFIEKVAKMGVMDIACDFTEAMERSKKIPNIAKNTPSIPSTPSTSSITPSNLSIKPTTNIFFIIIYYLYDLFLPTVPIQIK